jgi:hypothetical protein
LESVKHLAAFQALYAQTQAIVDTFLANHKDVVAIIQARHEEMKALQEKTQIRSDSLQTI